MKEQKGAFKERKNKLIKATFKAKLKKLKNIKGAVSKKEFYKITKDK